MKNFSGSLPFQMYQLQAILGHKSISMTIDLYGQLKATDIEKINLYPNSKSQTFKENIRR